MGHIGPIRTHRTNRSYTSYRSQSYTFYKSYKDPALCSLSLSPVVFLRLCPSFLDIPFFPDYTELYRK